MKKYRVFLAGALALAFLFGTLGTAYGMEQAESMNAGPATSGVQEGSVVQDVYQHQERREFEVKNRVRNEGEDYQVRVEEKLQQQIMEGIEDQELARPGAKGLERRIAELERKLAKNPDDQKVLWRLAVAYRNIGEYDKAIAVLKKLEGLLPHPTAKVAVLLAQCLRAKGDKEAALEELEKLAESADTVAGAVYAYRAILKEELGKVGEAAKDLEKAIAEQPKERDFYKKVGELYSKAGKKGIKVFVKGKKLKFDVEPFVENGRTLVPVRAIAEALGLQVDYKEGVVTITNPANGKIVVLHTGRAEAVVDGRKVGLEVPAKVVPPGRTVVPLRFVGENFGADVEWFENGQVVAVNEK
ncbi:Tetratricopeptide repeat-containing protein [Thermanaeromonas toyohensis ToBE]|uniref:Tetratricopeptide repeat-containing protein n=1 Tax=Thermanaeromonas toyohensis ToBE TaxID=698762 RepID=A0A1W1VUV8_9FIRM|nr:tetratricopeptide repeat protein [Thermanaeromonas toyohensis]SMB96664.1 Tetratricopeptide repeat-containing protein [Thermanaeromonas toyohensis ToBE]